MPERRAWGWVALLSLVPFLGWWAYGLFDLDEGFYAAIVTEMLRRGELITPYFNGAPWFEKPILTYWLAMPTVALFGPDFGMRLPNVLATVATGLLIGRFVAHRVSREAGIVTSLIFAGSLLPLVAGRLMLTDPPYVLAMTGMFVCFWRSLEEGPHPDRWRVAAAACLGVAVLGKGPVGGAFFLLVAGLTAWRLPELRPRFRGGWVVATLAFLAIVATWYLPAYLVNGRLFVDEFLIKQNLGRFTGGDAAHTITAWWGYLLYLPIVYLGLAPYTGHVHRVLRPTDPLRRYLLIWTLTVFVFFTISKAKLPHYILPMVPPLAALLGIHFAERWKGLPPLRFRAMAAWIVFVGAFAQFGLMTYYHGGLGLPGFHAEIHALAREVRSRFPLKETVAMYRMSRLDRSLGTFGAPGVSKPRVQETSHPSVISILDRTMPDTGDFGELLRRPEEVVILTRWNRIGDEQISAAAAQGRSLRRLGTRTKQDLYAVWVLAPAP